MRGTERVELVVVTREPTDGDIALEHVPETYEHTGADKADDLPLEACSQPSSKSMRSRSHARQMASAAYSTLAASRSRTEHHSASSGRSPGSGSSLRPSSLRSARWQITSGYRRIGDVKWQ